MLATGLAGAGFSPAAPAADVVVSAAASLTNAFTAIARSFEARHPGDHVLLNFGASGTLLQQMKNGAPVDAFASADEDTMDRAARMGAIQSGTRQDFAANRLVVIVPSGGGRPGSLDALASPSFRRVAVGLPALVPAGNYARRALQGAGLWDRLSAKTVEAHSVREVLDFVARGEADAGFVYATDAMIMPDKVRVALEAPLQSPVRYPIALTEHPVNAALARQFIGYVRSPEGQAALRRFGFTPMK